MAEGLNFDKKKLDELSFRIGQVSALRSLLSVLEKAYTEGSSEWLDLAGVIFLVGNIHNTEVDRLGKDIGIEPRTVDVELREVSGAIN